MNRPMMINAAAASLLAFTSNNDTDIDEFESVFPNRRPSQSDIPSWKLQDIIRLVILPVLFLVGAPLNLAALSHLMTEKKTCSTVASRMHLLKLHLNISDLMILFIYTASQVCWLITYEWRGGEFLCRLVKFSHTLSFGISSNVVVCIAFDRLASIFETKRRRSGERRKPGLRRVKISLILAWSSAIACALPQFLVWTTHRPFPGSSWTQCISIFYIQEAIAKRANQTYPFLITKSGYAAFHVLVIFWIPALIIAICYWTVMAWLFWHDRRRVTNDTNKCRWFRAILNRFTANPVPSTPRYTPRNRPRSVQVGVLTDDKHRASILRNGYGSLEAPDVVNLAHPTSPKGSGCSSTPLLATSVGDHAGSRTSANITLSPAVLDLQRVKRRAMRSSVLLVIAYIATWLPYNVIAIWGLVDERHYRKYGISVSFLQYLIVFNSVVNPFLYGTVGKLKRYLRDQ